MPRSQRIIVLLSLGCLPFLLPAQSVERWRAQLRSTHPDTTQLKLLLELGNYYLYKAGESKPDLDSALYFFQKAQQLNTRLRSQKWGEEISWSMCACHFEAMQPQLGEKFCLSLVKKHQQNKNKALEAAAWMKMGALNRSPEAFGFILSSLEKAYTLFQQMGKSEEAINALKEIADIHLNQGKLRESENELLRVIKEYRAIGYRNLHYTYDLLAAISTLRGNLDRALYYGLEMMKSMEATGDSSSASTFYYRMARVYDEMNQPAKSVVFYRRSLDMDQSANYGLVIAITRNMIQLGQAEEGLTFAQDRIRAFPPENDFERAFAANSLGACYEALGQNAQAEKQYLNMVYYEKQVNSKNYYTARANISIGQFYVKQQKFRQAEPYLKTILDIPLGILTTKMLRDNYLLLFKVDSAQGKYLSAIQHFQQHKLLNDSIFSETKSRQIEELQIKYETAQKEQDIKNLQTASILQANSLQQANLSRNLSFTLVALSLAFLAFLYNRLRTRQRITRKLEFQQIEINQNNRRLQNLLEEKERLLREIHHRVKNNLQIVMSLLNSQAIFLEDGASLAAIRDSQHRVQSIALIHQKLYQSSSITKINMADYIQELVNYLQDSFGLGQKVQFELQVEPLDLDVTQAVPLGLILNEAISNAVKYAFPKNQQGQVWIHLQAQEEEQYLLCIRDNGVGLPADFDLEQSYSLGMSLMKGLSKQLLGTLHLYNENGLEVQIQFQKVLEDQEEESIDLLLKNATE